MEAGEFELIDKIRRQAGQGAELQLGIGDDCSAINVPPGHSLLTSTDLLLEGVHFRLDWTDLVSLGNKTVAVNVSDIAAMGARPLCLYLGLGLPLSFSDRQVEQFLAGFFASLEDYDIFLAGGDTCRSNGPLMLAVTVQGLCPEGQLVTRAGAVVGDDLWVSGTLGDSALALGCLLEGSPLPAPLADRHFRPIARVKLGQRLAAEHLATAMLDLSDGLSGDLRHLLLSSGVGARVVLSQLPLSEEFRQALSGDRTLIDLALSGGEDYELLFTARTGSRARIEALATELPISLQRIGEITSGSELCLLDAAGQSYQPRRQAFDHFDRSRSHQP